MTPPRTPGTAGYSEQAERLIERFRTIDCEELYRAELPLLPTSPGRVLDLGAGIGMDAAWLARRGHRVLAVEPTEEFRAAGQRLHPAPEIEWLDDALPLLERVAARGEIFDLILLSAVWMHLDAAERSSALPRVAALLAPGGLLLLSLRHGPVPEGRRIFAVTAEETIELARAQGLELLQQVQTESIQEFNRAAGVTWTRLAFRGGRKRKDSYQISRFRQIDQKGVSRSGPMEA